MTLTVRYFAWLRERVGEPSEEVETFLKDFPTLDIAAYNSPKAVTVAGPVADIDAALKAKMAAW